MNIEKTCIDSLIRHYEKEGSIDGLELIDIYDCNSYSTYDWKYGEELKQNMYGKAIDMVALARSGETIAVFCNEVKSINNYKNYFSNPFNFKSNGCWRDYFTSTFGLKKKFCFDYVPECHDIDCLDELVESIEYPTMEQIYSISSIPQEIAEKPIYMLNVARHGKRIEDQKLYSMLNFDGCRIKKLVEDRFDAPAFTAQTLTYVAKDDAVFFNTDNLKKSVIGYGWRWLPENTEFGSKEYAPELKAIIDLTKGKYFIL